MRFLKGKYCVSGASQTTAGKIGAVKCERGGKSPTPYSALWLSAGAIALMIHDDYGYDQNDSPPAVATDVSVRWR